jgi:hypothetical protein
MMVGKQQVRPLNVDQVISHTGGDVKEAMKLIMQPGVTLAACSLEHETEFIAACASYERFARSNNLTPASDCFYQLVEEVDRKLGICFLDEHDLIGGVSCQSEDENLLQFFNNIGFAQADPKSTQIIIRKVLDNRQLLADLFPGVKNAITTQINISRTFLQPHIHNDIAAAVTICGPTTIFVAPEESKKLPLRAFCQTGSDLKFCYVPGNFKEVCEVDGAMSMRRHQLVLFKGAKTAELPFGEPGNFDTLHYSPADQHGQPRMFIVSFVTPPGWGAMEIFKPLALVLE